MIQIRESTNRVRVFESRAHPVFNQSSGGSFPSYAIPVAFARWKFLLHAATKNSNAAKFFLSLKQNNSEVFIGAPKILLISRILGPYCKLRTEFFSIDLWPKRVGIYAVEQFSLLFSKDKLKQEAHIHQTHDPQLAL